MVLTTMLVVLTTDVGGMAGQGQTSLTNSIDMVHNSLPAYRSRLWDYWTVTAYMYDDVLPAENTRNYSNPRK